MRSTTLLTMSTLCQLLGWILNLYGRSLIRECMLHPLLFLFLLQLILLSVQLHVLPWVATSTHLTPSLFHSLCSHDLHVASSPHSRSLQSFFHHQWIYLSLQTCSTFVLSTTLLLHSLHLVCYLQMLCGYWWPPVKSTGTLTIVSLSIFSFLNCSTTYYF